MSRAVRETLSLYSFKGKIKALGIAQSLSYSFKTVCKPSSVVFGHLSTNIVSDIPQRRFVKLLRWNSLWRAVCQSCFGWGLHSQARYRAHGALLPHLSILTENRRFISVALSLKSPSPGFLRHPVSKKLGLSSLAVSLRPRDRITILKQVYFILFCFFCQSK